MKNGIIKLVVLAALLPSNLLMAQATQSGSSQSFTTIVMIAFIALIILAIILGQFFFAKPVEGGASSSPKLSSKLGGAKAKVLKQGYNLNLVGSAKNEIESIKVNTFALQPPNFRGIAPIPKMMVAEGDTVTAGQALFFDKANPEIKYVAPVSGEIAAINRGAKRSIAEVVILADKEMKYTNYNVPNLDSASREELVNFMKESGAWTLIVQRPFDVIPDENVVPKNIFISTFDTAPLAPNLNLAVEGRGDAFQKGLDVLAKLTSGKVHLGLNADVNKAPSEVFTSADGVQKNWFLGKHPAGNVGIQIHHTAPIGTTDTVWTLHVHDVLTLGELFLSGKWNTQKIVAITGAEVLNPKYVRTYTGANIGDLTNANLSENSFRIISGDVLSGAKKETNNFLNAFDDQISVIEEGDYFELFGWLLPSRSRPSASSTYPNILNKGTRYKVDTNTHGEKRAFVLNENYEDVLPMDILPQHLMKAIITNDYERMEGLGIHELTEEDIALCEFICVSKQPWQKTLREGLDMVLEQS